MKTIHIVLFFIVSYAPISAQTILKPLPLSALTYHSTTLSLDDTTIWAPRVQQHFMMGWQWAGPNINTNKRLHCNFYQSHYGYPGTRTAFKDIPDSGGVKYLVWQHLSRNDADDIWGLGGERGMIFDPVANADGSVRVGDTTGAVLGFITRNMTYGSLNSSGDNFDRFSLDTTTSFSTSERDTGIIVLDNPVIDNNYYQWNTSATDLVTNEWSGRWWYVSLNLRRTSTTDLAMNNDTLLTINIPYTLDNNTKGFIVFEEVSKDSSLHAYSLPNNRGKVLSPQYIAGGTNKFVVMRKMLPVGSNRDVTITAFFRFKNPTDTTIFNPWLIGANDSTNPTKVVKLGLTVRYHGRNKVSIDWLRIGTQAFEHLMLGQTDSVIWEYTRHTLSILEDSINAGRNFRLMAFYGVDEPPPLYYAAMRYYRSLYDGRLLTEAQLSSNGASPMNLQNTWAGGITGVDYFYTPTPMMNWGNSGSKYNFYIKNGWYHPSLTNDKGTAYETDLVGRKIKNDDSSDGQYYRNFSVESNLNPNVSNTGSLACYEGAMIANFYENNFAYADKPWWTNIWGTGGGFTKWNPNEADRDFGFRYKKHLTGEEMRSQIWTPILHGAKGIMYDRMYLDTLQLWPTRDVVIIRDAFGVPIDTINYCDTCSSLYNQERIKFFGMMNRINQIPDSLEGTDLINSDIAGSDFLRAGDPTHFDMILNLDTVAYYMGVPQGRVYLGRKSMRREVMKAHDFILENDATLMKMKLVSWFGKGFYIVKTGDTTTFNKFVALDTSKFATRPPFRTHYDSTTQKTLPYYEDSDSTFYDVMLHRLGTTPLDSMFILGVMNRHSSPLLTGYDYVNSKDTSYFITTPEFDSMVQLHPEKKYIQAGAREITVPFNYTDTNGRFALLRIRELTGTFDTIIGQNSSMSVKFLPGEGKLFKVQIVRPNEVRGELAFSNQTKIVAYPKMNHTTGKWLETDTLVHYMTYHKRIHSDSNGLTGVYFRKSKPATKNMNTAAIQWEDPEYLLSYSVYHNGANYIDCDTCAFPSIVCRFDSLSQEYRSFVVYGCTSDYKSNPPTPENYQYIVESVVRVRNDSVIGDYQGRALAIAAKRDLAQWGTPSINASDSINFYSWADAYSGIMAAWKKPDTGQFAGAPINIHWVNSCTTYTAQHPSMNPYSRYMRGEQENDCALVWQENLDCGGYNHPKIFYTRLHIDEYGQIRKGLSPQYITDTSMAMLFNADTSIFCASIASPTYSLDTYWDYDEHRFPVVYRDVFFADTDTNVCNFESYYQGYKRASLKFDRIYWQFLNPLVMVNYAPLTKIKHRLVRLVDTVIGNTFTPLTLDIAPLINIWHSGYVLDQPVVSAGDGYDYSYFPDSLADLYNCFNYSHRAVNLNFRSRPPWYHSLIDNGIIDTLAQIIHFPQEVFAELTDQSVSTVDVGLLSDVHLAERGSLDANHWQKNHRIYNKRPNQEPLPAPAATIRSSGQYYFRTSTQPTARRFYGFGDDSLSFGVSSIIIDEGEYALKEERAQTPFEKMRLPDTISTDWFTIDNIETMDVITSGASSDKLNAWLERRDDGTTWDVPLTSGEQMKITRETIELENGDNKEYRVRIRSNNYAPYHSETAITDDNEESGYGKGSGKEYSSINLGDSDPTQTVFVYPNPAREEVHLTIKGTERSEVIIVSAIGGEATRFFTDGGKTISVNTSTFPSGMYVVRVKREGMKDAVTPFVILR